MSYRAERQDHEAMLILEMGLGKSAISLTAILDLMIDSFDVGKVLVIAPLRVAISASQVERVQYLVGHHHTFSCIDGIDYQILIEADYIANASENEYDVKNIENFMNKIVKTNAGKQLIKSVFCL